MKDVRGRFFTIGCLHRGRNCTSPKAIWYYAQKKEYASVNSSLHNAPKSSSQWGRVKILHIATIGGEQSDNLIVPAESDLVSEPVCYNTYKVEWPERECGRKIRTLSQLRMVWPSCLKESLRNPQRQIYDCRCIERYVICWGEGSFDIWAIVALPYDMYLLTWSVYSYCLMYHKDKPQNKLLRLFHEWNME